MRLNLKISNVMKNFIITPMKNLVFYFLFLPVLLFSQEYERSWGTYIGPAGSVFASSAGNDNLVLGGGNIHMFSQIITNSSYTVSYYSQFTTTGPAYNMSEFSNFYSSSVMPNGSLITASYHDQDEFSNPNSFFDSAGNRYALTFSQAGLTMASTPGTWFSAPDNDVNKRLLSKYDPIGNLLWQSYLPYDSGNNTFATDEFGNIYIAGNTDKQAGITTVGVLQENYEIVYGSNNTVLANSYIAKLNPSGQVMWATYFPALFIYKLNYYAGNLYVLSSRDLNPSGSTMATQGSFQTAKAESSITKMNAQNGTRIWGTYYGPTDTGVMQLPSGMITNSSGVYLIGDIYDFSGNNNSYFGTPGSFQPVASGYEDIYLSKFDHNGSRLWSTYFGSPGSELSGFGGNPIDFLGNNLIVTLVQFSNQSTNLATPGSYIDAPPTVSGPNGFYNIMFAKFNENGGREWSSYYGGASNNSLNPTIGVAVKDINTFYLYGSTSASTGISTEGAIQPTTLPNQRTGFLARFNLKTAMSTSETDLTKDLVLYDNPNNGDFSISGSVFQKFSCEMNIYDTAARKVYRQKLSKNKKQFFGLAKYLSKGNYLVEVSKSGAEKLKTFKMIVK